jgi:integrase
MPRLNGRLTALAVKHANACGRYADGGGLYLQVSPNGSRSWILRYRLGGRRRHLGLGPLPRVTLAEARDLASTARQTLRDGRDPIEAKGGRARAATVAAIKAMTFGACAQAYIEAHRPAWAPKNTKQWLASLTTYALPILGPLPVEAVDTGLVMRCVEPFWATKNETADRTRGRIEAILDWARARGFRDGENPARWKGHLANLLPATAKVAKVEHHAAMAYAELPAFVAALRARDGVAERALEFAILTAARSGEVFGAQWGEIDLQARVWTVPAARMKAGKDHRVPLGSAALTLLGALPGPHTGLVFPGFKAGRPLAKMALTNAMRRAGGDGATVHGMRSAFRDWAGDRTTFARDVVEAALAHRVGDATEAAYRRGDALEKRRKLMETWAGFLASEVRASATVTELRRA